VREVGEHAAFLVENLSANGNTKLDRGAGGAVAVRALPVASALAAELTFPLEKSEISQIGVCHEDDIAALAPVTAVRATLRDVFLAAKADRPVAAATALDRDACPVVKQG
jgi:hypothetical protein